MIYPCYALEGEYSGSKAGEVKEGQTGTSSGLVSVSQPLILDVGLAWRCDYFEASYQTALVN